jgi:hypothetical protein
MIKIVRTKISIYLPYGGQAVLICVLKFGFLLLVKNYVSWKEEMQWNLHLLKRKSASLRIREQMGPWMEALTLNQKRGADEGIWIEIEQRRARIDISSESASEERERKRREQGVRSLVGGSQGLDW